MTNQFPIDFSSLKKGDQFSADDIFRIMGGRKPGDKRFKWSVLRLKSLIEKKTTFSCSTTVEDGLRVLHDGQASFHNNKIANTSLRMYGRRVTKLGQVDTDNLTESELLVHDKNMSIHGRLLGLLRGETRIIRGLARPENDTPPNLEED